MPTVLTDDYIQDPHRVAELLRAEGPVRHVVLPTGMPAWLVTGYAEARELLTDPRLSSNGVYDRLEKLRGAATGEPSSFSPDLARHLLNTDPPDHTRLRKLVNKAFTPRVIERLRPRIEEIADELLDAIEQSADDPIDLLPAYAYPLPITVICELLGIPVEDQDRFGQWSGSLVSTAGPKEIGEASAAMGGYLFGLIEQKRAEPADDLLSALVHAADDGDRLTVPELIAMTFVLLIGGYETTVNLIGSGVLSLLTNPAELERLRADRSLLRNGIEELLRYETPNNMSSPRYTTEPIKVGDVEIPANEFVLVSLLAANRDPARFDGADRLDIARPTSGHHLGFGHGIHFCVGAPLGRLEGEIAIGKLLDRFPALRLAVPVTELRWRPSTAMRALQTLPVHVR
ncbi:cytochrome P450 [Kribbella sandramycini]|uniref:Cytochrome P450 n=1 Tax=Kribbella sandramycini TaxID=60450 RepID=A0A7Y4KXK3_9ACTN|nr:cytochrome P450 [Kribbella sandramycini]MBB6569670.1 cytochrome P450 [Kribbella sandramycini]NOL40498.1 cytochrome P450 [Kribbella sandramycini]